MNLFLVCLTFHVKMISNEFDGVLQSNRHNLPKKSNFRVSFSDIFWRTLKSDSDMSDLHSIQRSSEVLQKTAGVSPCRRPWYLENHLDCFRLTTAVQTACVWQFWIRDYILIVTPSLKSLKRSPFLHTVSKALLVDVPKKMTKMLLLCSGLILFLADQGWS